MDTRQVLTAVTADVYEKFKQAVALRKWSDGKPLTSDQLEICLQAIITYEHANFPEDQRSGYVPPKEKACDSPLGGKDEDSAITWK